MKRLIVRIVAIALLLSVPRVAMPQARTLKSEMRVETGTVEAIEASTRTVTLKKPDGTVVTVFAKPDIERFAELKVGDKITARFYENVVVRLKRPGESDVESLASGTTGAERALPGGTRARQMTLTAMITAIDPAAPSVTFTGPNGYKYTSKVEDPAALGKVKVGDKVEIVWTEAMLVSLERGK